VSVTRVIESEDDGVEEHIPDLEEGVEEPLTDTEESTGEAEVSEVETEETEE